MTDSILCALYVIFITLFEVIGTISFHRWESWGTEELTGSTSQLVSGGTTIQTWTADSETSSSSLALTASQSCASIKWDILSVGKHSAFLRRADLQSPPQTRPQTAATKWVLPQAGTTLPDRLLGQLWFLSSKMWFGWQTADFWGLPLAPFSQWSCYYVTQLLYYIMWVRDHLSFSHVDRETRVAPSGLDWAGGKPPRVTAWHSNWMRVGQGDVFHNPNPNLSGDKYI